MRDKDIILYMDNHLIVAHKAAGRLSQGDRTRDVSLLDLLKNKVADKFAKKGNIFVGLVHRLDRPVSGLMVFARTSKAAARISKQIREHQFKKSYMALVEGKTPACATWSDFLQRNGKKSQITIKNGKLATLSFKRIGYTAGISLVEIQLDTGRHHQIRAQFAAKKYPIVGDTLYDATQQWRRGEISLHSYRIVLQHPISSEHLEFYSQIPSEWKRYLTEND